MEQFTNYAVNILLPFIKHFEIKIPISEDTQFTISSMVDPNVGERYLHYPASYLDACRFTWVRAEFYLGILCRYCTICLFD